MNKKVIISGIVLVLLSIAFLIGFAQFAIYQLVEPFKQFSVTNTMGNILEDVGPSVSQWIDKNGGNKSNDQ